jgi:hypothetical protein
MAEGDQPSHDGESPEPPRAPMPETAQTPEFRTGTFTSPHRMRIQRTSSQFSTVRQESEPEWVSRPRLEQPAPVHEPWASGITQNLYETDDGVDMGEIAEPAAVLEDQIEALWQIHGVERLDRRQVMRSLATQNVMDAVTHSRQNIPENSPQWRELIMTSLTRIVKRYVEARQQKAMSRASTPMGPVMIPTPSIQPTISQWASAPSTSPQHHEPSTHAPMERSPTIERAVANIAGPRMTGEADEQFRRRMAAMERMHPQDGMTIPKYSGGQPGVLGEAPNTDNKLVYPFVTRRTLRADNWKDRVVYQKMRREDLAKFGSSAIDDQNVGFSSNGVIDLDVSEPEVPDVRPKIEDTSRLSVFQTPAPLTTIFEQPRTNMNKDIGKSGVRFTPPTPREPELYSPPVRKTERDPIDIRSYGIPGITPERRSQRGYSEPRVHGPRSDAPGVIEAADRHRSVMEQRLSQLIHEALSVKLTYPDGFKFSQKLEAGNKYTGSAKFADLEDWLSDLVYRMATRQLGGPDLDRFRVLIVSEHLGGEAHTWYHRHVTSTNRTKLDWTFESIILALYNRFVHATTMQDAREGFRRAKYSASRGVQSYYDELIGYAKNMAAYPDDYSFIEVFLDGIPKEMRSELIKERGLSPEVHFMEDFVAFAVAFEARVKTDDYYNRKARIQSSQAEQPKAPVPSREPSKSATTSRNPRFVHRGVPKLGTPQKAPAPKELLKDNPSQDNARNKPWVKPHESNVGGGHTHAADITCFNCGHRGHYAKDCKEPKKPRTLHARALRDDAQESEDGDDRQNEGDDHNSNESKSEVYCASNCEECAEPLEDGEHYTDIEVEGYETDDSAEFMRVMTVVKSAPSSENTENNVGSTDHHDWVRAAEANNAAEDVHMRKVRVRISNKNRVRPVVRSEDKECLATYMNVGGMDAWTLWDSGSTTTGITPTFAHIAEITVDTLLDPHILQLGTIGSRSVIKYGADVMVDVAGKIASTYVDVANFDRYDMIIGTPFMRAHKVILDFVDNVVIIDGKRMPATKVQLKDTDGRLRRYRASEKEPRV